MAERELIEQKESEKILKEILTHISNKENFLLSGGAGSGKTYTLVQVIRNVLDLNPTEKIACITYTNAAVKEIKERVSHSNLTVSTIHDFLWDLICSFKIELKKMLIDLINDPNEALFRIEGEDGIPNTYFDNITMGVRYLEYKKLKEAIISHDELLVLASRMFRKYKRLCDIFKDKYKFLFVDEYQDTSPYVIEILLESLKKSSKSNTIGFFGDSMQSIYDDGIGDINKYIQDGTVKEVIKEQNRRNPQLVIDLANNLRSDNVKQKPSDDLDAPNMINGTVKQGDIKFIYSKSTDLDKLRQYLGWNFNDSKVTKELNLTHNLIAEKAGFKDLMDIYDKDQVIKYRDRIKKYIKDNSIADDFSLIPFGEVIEILKKGKTGRDLNPILPTRAMQEFIDQNLDLYNKALTIKYADFAKLYIDADQLIDDKKQDIEDENKKGSRRDNLIKHLFKIQDAISHYNNKRYNEFLKTTGYKFTTLQDKKYLKNQIDLLSEHIEDKTIEQVIDACDGIERKCICLIDDKLSEFKINNMYVYDRVKDVPYKVFQNLYNYLEGFSPFSTQHKTKGAEFNNVLIILDNGNWNKYNFENLFLENGNENVLKRTQKIFYVCCTRAKDNLAVFFHNPSDQIIAKAKIWFNNNIIDIDSLPD